jgi:hypothetical protein
MIPPQLQAPVFAALLFIVISAPVTYKATNDFITYPILKSRTHVGGMPTKFGLVLHALVFFALSYGFLANK